MISPPPRSTPFPYTTLFRSREPGHLQVLHREVVELRVPDLRARALRRVGREDVRAAAADPDRRLVDRAVGVQRLPGEHLDHGPDRKSTRLNSSHPSISYAVF